MSKIARLEKWSYVTKHQHKKHSGLAGDVYDSPQFDNGQNIITSKLADYDNENDVFITTRGSRYKLGEIDPEYAEMCPDAKERIIEVINKRKQESTMHTGDISLTFESDFDDTIQDWLKDPEDG